jgi:limonene-1,2-epoxide hydrolase
MESNDDIVRRFCGAFQHMDADELIEFFSEDATYHNIPLPLLRGRDEIYNNLKGLRKRFTALRIEIIHQISDGGIVMNERVDYFTRVDSTIALPIAGVFKLNDEKIQEWREYFDLATFTGAPKF